MSIPHVAAMILMLVGGSIAEWIGRKHTLIVGQVCMMLGWIIVYFAKTFSVLLIGRFITNAGTGISFPVQTLQLSEIALVRMRGMLSMLSYLVMNVGNLYSLIVAANCSINTLILSLIVPSVVFLVLSIFLPESPMWLVKKQHLDRAKQSLKRLRGSDYETEEEIKELEALVQSQDESSFSEKWNALKTRSNIIPCAIMTLILTIQV